MEETKETNKNISVYLFGIKFEDKMYFRFSTSLEQGGISVHLGIKIKDITSTIYMCIQQDVTDILKIINNKKYRYTKRENSNLSLKI